MRIIYQKKGVIVKEYRDKNETTWTIRSIEEMLTKEEVQDLGSILLFRATASSYRIKDEVKS